MSKTRIVADPVGQRGAGHAPQAGSGVRCVIALVGRDGDRLAAVEAELARTGASRYTTVVSAPTGIHCTIELSVGARAQRRASLTFMVEQHFDLASPRMNFFI